MPSWKDLRGAAPLPASPAAGVGMEAPSLGPCTTSLTHSLPSGLWPLIEGQTLKFHPLPLCT